MPRKKQKRTILTTASLEQEKIIKKFPPPPPPKKRLVTENPALKKLIYELSQPFTIKKRYYSIRKEGRATRHFKWGKITNPWGAGFKKRSQQIKDLQYTIENLTAGFYNDIHRATLLYAKLNDIQKDIKESELYLFDSALDRLCKELQKEILKTRVPLILNKGKKLSDLSYQQASLSVVKDLKKNEPDTKFLGFKNRN